MRGIVKCLKKRGYPVDEESEISEDEPEIFSDVQSASGQALIALGERRGQKVRRLSIIGRGGFDGAVRQSQRFLTPRQCEL